MNVDLMIIRTGAKAESVRQLDRRLALVEPVEIVWLSQCRSKSLPIQSLNRVDRGALTSDCCDQVKGVLGD